MALALVGDGAVWVVVGGVALIGLALWVALWVALLGDAIGCVALVYVSQ